MPIRMPLPGTRSAHPDSDGSPHRQLLQNVLERLPAAVSENPEDGLGASGRLLAFQPGNLVFQLEFLALEFSDFSIA